MFRRFKIWHSEVCIDFHTLMGPKDRVQKVQGSRVRRVQRSEHPRERIQGSRVKHSREGTGLRAPTNLATGSGREGQ